MSEESAEQPIDQEEKTLHALQQEGALLFAQAGEKQYLIAMHRKDLLKLNIKIRKINHKVYPIMQSLQMKQAAKADAAPEAPKE